MVFLSISRQIGHISSECKLLGETAISVESVMSACAVRCNSYRDSSHDLPTAGDASVAIGADGKVLGNTGIKYRETGGGEEGDEEEEEVGCKKMKTAGKEQESLVA